MFCAGPVSTTMTVSLRQETDHKQSVYRHGTRLTDGKAVIIDRFCNTLFETADRLPDLSSAILFAVLEAFDRIDDMIHTCTVASANSPLDQDACRSLYVMFLTSSSCSPFSSRIALNSSDIS